MTSRPAIPRRSPSSRVLSTLLALIPALAAAQMPPDYIRTARAVAAPLYAHNESRPAPSLSACTARDGGALATISSLAVADQKLLTAAGSVGSELSEAAFCLLSIAAIDGVEPEGTDLLKRGLDALVGDKEAEDRFANTLGGVIVAELAKLGLRDAYRNSLDRRRAAALPIWKIAQAHAGPAIPLHPVYGIGIQLHPAGRRINSVLQGHAAERAGLRPGDTILAIDGRPVRAMSFQRIATLIRGPKDTSARLRLRTTDGRERDATAKRTTLVSDSPLHVDLNASWSGAFEGDWLWMTNLTGLDLHNVTVYVQLHSGDRRINHIHFTPSWAAGERKHATYFRKCDYSPDESADHIDAVHIWIFSDEARFDRRYDYAGAQLDADIDQWFPALKFTGGHRAPHEGLFSDKPAGFQASFTGADQIAPHSVVVTLVDGDISQTVTWTMNGPWKSGGWANAKEFRHKTFNGLNPDRVDMTFHFPGSQTPRKLTWNLN